MSSWLLPEVHRWSDTDTPRPHEASTFSRSADASFSEARAIYADRGDSYGDTWALPNQKSAVTEYVLGLQHDHDRRGWLRLLQLASLIDLKDSRLLGGGNVRDSLLDGLNYRAVFAELLREYLGG